MIPILFISLQFIQKRRLDGFEDLFVSGHKKNQVTEANIRMAFEKDVLGDNHSISCFCTFTFASLCFRVIFFSFSDA